METIKAHSKEIDKLNSPKSIEDIEFVIGNLPTKETPGLHDFINEFYQTLKEGNSTQTFLEIKK
jgi:hypothetical protein